MVHSFIKKFCVLTIVVCMTSTYTICQNAISCVGSFNLSLNNCESDITPQMVSAGAIGATGYTVMLTDKHGNVLPSTIIDGDHIGKEITYKLTESTGGNSCWGVITVEDKIAPTIDCATTDTTSTMCYSMDAFTIAAFVEDNCDPNPELVILDEFPIISECHGQDNIYLKTLRRTYIAIDKSGNKSEPCDVDIKVRGVSLTSDIIMGPPDTTVLCGNFVEDYQGHPSPISDGSELDTTMVPYVVIGDDTIALYPDDDAISHCKLSVVYNDELILDTDCTKKIIRTWTLIESCLNNPEQLDLIQQINIMDSIPPVISGLPDTMHYNTSGLQECVAVAPAPFPELSDNCQSDIYLTVMIDGKEPAIPYTGQVLTFPEGCSELIYIATDLCVSNGQVNESRDTVKIWVEDNTPPVCVADGRPGISLNNDTGEVLVNASVFDEGSYDDCSGKVKIFAKRDNADCRCIEEDAENRYNGFYYLGRFTDHDYYISEDSLIAPKAFRIAKAMGGYIVNFKNAAERNFVQDAVSNYGTGYANPVLDPLTYLIDDTRDGYNCATTGSNSITTYDGLVNKKLYVIEVEDLCGYSELVRFCCADQAIGGGAVSIRVMDKWGNYNECSDTVDIQNKIPPKIECPLDIEVVCTDNRLDDLTLLNDIFGVAHITENACVEGPQPLDFEDNRNECGIGYIIRTYDDGLLSCLHTIKVIDTINMTNFEVIDPEPLYIDTCVNNLDLDPERLDPIYRPQFTGQRQCGEFWVGYEDDRFDVDLAGENACYKIVRKWLILDECDSLNIDTLYEYDQSIVVTNTIAPTIVNNSEDEACTNDGNCDTDMITLDVSFSDDCTPDDELVWRWSIDYHCDGVEDFSGTGAGPRLLLTRLDSVGMHKISVIVSDGCGNETSLVHEYDIKACENPLAKCQALTMPLHFFPEPPDYLTIDGDTSYVQTTFDLDEDGVDEGGFVYMCSEAVWFSTDSIASSHPCDLPLTYSFSPDPTDTIRCFSCQHLCEPQVVEIYVTDSEGNQDMCITEMTLTDPKGLCDEVADCVIPPTDLTGEISVCDDDFSPANLILLGIDTPSVDMTCCDDFTISFVDDLTQTDDDGCMVLVRTWTVNVNCGCTREETFVQRIKILNVTDPSITCPANVTVEANALCRRRVDLDAVVAGGPCHSGIVVTNDFNGQGGNVNAVFPIGDTFVRFTVTDACDNTNTCRTRVRVVDNTDPTCTATDITVSLDNMSITLTEDQIISQLLTTSDDNCGVIDTTVVPATLDCDDISNSPIPITITVSDDAGNTSTCVANVTVEDNVTPTIICPSDIESIDTVMLNANCRARIPNFVDLVTTMQNCETIMTITQSPAANTLVEAVGSQTVTVTADIPGFPNQTCDFTVVFVDNRRPVITCPDDQTIMLDADCEADIPALVATATDNCTADADIAITQNPTAGSALTGVTTVTMTATDASGNTATCDVVLTPGGFPPIVITCPDTPVDLAKLCGQDIDTSNLPDATATGGCGMLVITVVDTYTGNDCLGGSLSRVFTATDDAGQSVTCTQTINVPPANTDSPVISAIGDVTLTANLNCEATVNQTFTITDQCFTSLTVTSTNPGVTISGPAAGGVYTVNGTFIAEDSPVSITINAEDECGNAALPESFTVTIIDQGGVADFECKKLVKALEDTNPISVTFHIDEIVCITGGGGCLGTAPLIASFSNDPNDTTRVFSCTDVGDVQVTLFIWDVFDQGGDGVLDTVLREPCFAIQTIVDPNGFCRGFTSADPNITGRITTEEGQGVESTSVALIGDNTEQYMTDEHGLYAFPSMAMGNQYVIKPEKDDEPINGVSTLDIILIQKHILGLAPLDSPYKLIAADANSSGSLTALDLITLRKLILSYYTELPNSKSWKMIDANYQFNDPENPFNDNYPEEYMISELSQHMAVDFIGVKMGDVNLSSDPNMLIKSDIRTSDELLTFDISPVVIGSEVTYEFRSHDFSNIEGFQFTLHFEEDDLKFVDVQGAVLDMKSENIGLSNIDNGQLTFSYDKVGGITSTDDEVLFSLSFEHNGNLQHQVTTSSKIISAQAYSEDAVMDINSRLITGQTDIVLYQNTPNPWSQSTTVSFSLPTQMNYTLKFYNVNGKLLSEKLGIGHSGTNEIVIQRQDVNTKGLVYYELITDSEKATKRMILLK